MKKVLSFFLSILLISAIVPISEISASAADDVIEIRTIAELYNINNNMSGNYKLMNDIDMTEDVAVGGNYGRASIGSTFTGTFDGNGHKIIGMRISTVNALYSGLFITNQGLIKNLNMDNCSVSNSIMSGSICAVNRGTIINCQNTGDISASGENYECYAGGICGVSESGSKVENCSNYGQVSSINIAGGICAISYGNNKFDSCSNYGQVSTCAKYGAYAGGICGYIYNGDSINRCFNVGEINAFSANEAYAYICAGGICAVSFCKDSGNIISNCYNTGQIISTNTVPKTCVGGICGLSSFSSGQIAPSSIVNCYNVGDLQSGYSSGNIICQNEDGCTLNNCYYISKTEDNEVGVKALTAEQMQSETNFTGFDFDNTWVILRQTEYEYPQLKNNLYKANPFQETEPTVQTQESGLTDPTQVTNPTEDTQEIEHTEPTETQSTNDPVIPITGTSGNFEYKVLSDSTAEITKYIGSSTNAVIPSSIGSYSVTSIGEHAFENCYKILSLTIPDSVTSIGNEAFYGCSGLGGVKIPDSVTSIGDSAFYNSGLKRIVIPDSVTSLGTYVFYNCTSLTSVTIGNSVTSIGDYAFYWCVNLTSVTIPDSVTSIGLRAFAGCKNLTSVTIPDSVTSIGEYAFSGCLGLTSVTIGNSVTSIDLGAFSRCESLTNVTIGNSVTSIGKDAFNGCKSLRKIELPISVTKVGQFAFYGCNNLLLAIIPEDLDNYLSSFPTQTEIQFAKIKFTISFDANSGSDAPQELTLNAESRQASFTVPNQKPLKTGYAFVGWSEKPNSSANYMLGKTYTISKSLKLYAIWEITNTYIINFELCGGNSDISSLIKTEGVDLELNSIVPTHTNYIFAYWISSDKETTYSAGSTYKADANDTLYAVWKEVCPKCNGSPYSSTRCDKCHGTKYTSTTCDKCNGSKYSSIKKCSRCNGKGILTYTLTCDKCKGTGTISKTSTETCPLCKGNGYRIKDGNFEVCYLCSGMGEVTRNVQETCKNCGGDGQKDNEIRCSTCEGKGEIKTICDKCEGNGIIKKICVKCNGTGTLNTICDICHGVDSIIYHYPNCENGFQEHNWDNGTISKYPTCTTTGEKVYHCKNCGHTKTETLSALGHSFSNEYTVDKGATCTEDGLKSRHCSRCGAHTDEVVIEKRGYHDWYDGIYTKYPTCITEGEKTYYCKYCTQSKTEIIPALGHDFSNEYTVDKDATCTQDGIKSRHCSRCNAHTDEVVIEKLGYHDWDNGRITKQPTCITEGIRTRQCKYCIQIQTEIIPALGHNFSNQYTVDKAATCTEDGSKSRHCTRCETHTDELVIEKHGHHTELVSNHTATYFAKGYTGDKVCTVCGKVISKGKSTAKLILATPKVSITAGKQKLTVKYTKVKDATGFQVKYTYKGKTKTKTYTSKKSVTKIIKKLKKGTYKVSVRALIKSKGKTAYSNWTKTKKYKVK